ncbi:MAG: hypothetical protein RL701_8139 [Pseudomonadota bacterium]|jgi:hypothetical protein
MRIEKALFSGVFSLLALGCRGSPPLPSLSVHAFARLTERTQGLEQQQKRAVGAWLQLSFFTETRGKTRTVGASLADAALQPTAAFADDVCPSAALCNWAWLSEESALRALGVTP